MRSAVEKSKLDLYEREISELFESKCHLRGFIQEMKGGAEAEEGDVASYADSLPDIAMMPEYAKAPSVHLHPFQPPPLGQWLARVDLGWPPLPEATPNSGDLAPSPFGGSSPHHPNSQSQSSIPSGLGFNHNMVKLLDIPINIKKSKVCNCGHAVYSSMQ